MNVMLTFGTDYNSMQVPLMYVINGSLNEYLKRQHYLATHMELTEENV